MMMPGTKLLPYLDRMEFPVEILDETSSRVVQDAVTKDQLLYLIRDGLVVGFGSRTQIKTLRAFRQIKTAEELRAKSRWRVLSEAGRTVVRGEPLTDGIRLWKHHAGRCSSFQPLRPRANGDSL